MKPSSFARTRRAFLQTMAGGVAGLALPANSTLRAAKLDKPEFTIGLVADVQYADVPPGGQRHYRKSLAKLESCVQELNARSPAFTVHLGDLIDRDYENFDRVLPIYDRLSMPHYHVLGNHDFQIDQENKRLPYQRLGLKKGYYEFGHRGWRVIVLDGNDVSYLANTRDVDRSTDPEQALDAEEFRQAEAMMERLKREKRPNAYSWNGGVGGVQLV